MYKPIISRHLLLSSSIIYYMQLNELYIFFLAVLLARQLLFLLNLTTSQFCSGYFWDRVSLFLQAKLDHDPTIYAPHYNWDDRHALPCPAIFLLKWGLKYFLPGLIWTCDLLNLSLPSSKDYRNEPVMEGVLYFLLNGWCYCSVYTTSPHRSNVSLWMSLEC
jgi:hypothetical protein